MDQKQVLTNLEFRDLDYYFFVFSILLHLLVINIGL